MLYRWCRFGCGVAIGSIFSRPNSMFIFDSLQGFPMMTLQKHMGSISSSMPWILDTTPSCAHWALTTSASQRTSTLFTPCWQSATRISCRQCLGEFIHTPDIVFKVQQTFFIGSVPRQCLLGKHRPGTSTVTRICSSCIHKLVRTHVSIVGRLARLSGLQSSREPFRAPIYI